MVETGCWCAGCRVPGEKGREEKKKKAYFPSYEQSSRDTPKKERGDPEYSIQESQKERGREGGGGGTKLSTGSNEP